MRPYELPRRGAAIPHMYGVIQAVVSDSLR
jgi:hypothetical protein